MGAKYVITVEESDRGWEAVVEVTETDGRQGPMDLLAARPTLTEAMREAMNCLDRSTGGAVSRGL